MINIFDLGHIGFTEIGLDIKPIYDYYNRRD